MSIFLFQAPLFITYFLNLFGVLKTCLVIQSFLLISAKFWKLPCPKTRKICQIFETLMKHWHFQRFFDQKFWNLLQSPAPFSGPADKPFAWPTLDLVNLNPYLTPSAHDPSGVRHSGILWPGLGGQMLDIWKGKEWKNAYIEWKNRKIRKCARVRVPFTSLLNGIFFILFPTSWKPRYAG